MYLVKTSQNEKWIDRELSSLFQIGLVIEMKMWGVQLKTELNRDVESYPVWEDSSKRC